MRKPLRWPDGLALAACLCGLSPAWAPASAAAHHGTAPPYLRAAGPAPLRFQPAHAVSRRVLPPLFPLEHPAAAQPSSPTNSTPSAAGSAANRPVSSVVVAGAVAPAAPAGSIDGLPAPSGPTGQNSAPTLGIDPRILLEYLAPLGTNSPPRQGLASPGFVPPVAPPAPRSSQAIYEKR